MRIDERLKFLKHSMALRRNCTRELRAVTAELAGAIAEHTRNGDQVTVNGRSYRVARVTWEVAQAGGSPVVTHPKPVSALLVDGFALDDVRSDWLAPETGERLFPCGRTVIDSETSDVRWIAKDELRLTFLEEVGDVAKAFSELNRDEAGALRLAVERCAMRVAGLARP